MRKLFYNVLMVALLTMGAPLLAQNDASNAMPMEYGQTVSGTITDDADAALWTFNGTEGDVVSIEMTAADTTMLDPRLYLYTLAGYESGETYIAENDDFEGLNSRIDAFTLPETGDYVIEATRWRGEGTYDLTLSLGAEEADEDDMDADAGGGAQTIALDDGSSAVEIMIPADWATSLEGGVNAFASTTDALAVFSDEIVPAPDGAIVIGVISPEALSQIAAQVLEQTTEAYLEAALMGFGFEGEIRPYENFAVPASFTPITPSADAPENAVMFVLELEEGFTLVVSVTGGNPQDFEDEVVEIVNTMAGIEPSYATDDAMDDMSADASALDADLDMLEPRDFFSPDLAQQITISLPAEWRSDTSFGSIEIGSSLDAIRAARDNTDMPPGAFYMSVEYPTLLAESFGISATTAPDLVLETLNTALGSSGTIEEATALDVPAFFSTVMGSSILPDGVLIVALGFEDGTVPVAIQVGGSIDEFEPIITALLGSISYSTE